MKTLLESVLAVAMFVLFVLTMPAFAAPVNTLFNTPGNILISDVRKRHTANGAKMKWAEGACAVLTSLGSM
jgi:hypothetical protein